MVDILVGADPEVFVLEGGKPVSAHGLIPGTKKNPFKVEKGAVQVDGMALEFNIDPAKNEQEFIENVEHVLGILKGMVPKHDLLLEAIARFPIEYLETQPIEALELGCELDYCAYSGYENPSPNPNEPFRTAAGHIHIGWKEPEAVTEEHMGLCMQMAAQMDVFLGLSSLLFDPCTERRQLYGKAGAFRPKPYGMEYRVLSNKWLQSKKLMSFVYKNTVLGAKSLLDGVGLGSGDVEDIINNSDKDAAVSYMKRYGISYGECL